MRTRAAVYGRFAALFAVLSVLGIGATIYVLVHQRVVLPGADVYSIKARFSAANGVLAGTGQPVRVVGVDVGQVTAVELSEGTPVVTMKLRREKLPQVYRDASATLVPVTPLGDMSIELVPGAPPAPPLREGGIISLRATSTPVAASEVLARLDKDTRDYLTVLLSSLQRGLKGRAGDLRGMLRSLGPTVDQVGRINRALARRETQLAKFIHNLALITREATQDRQLTPMVIAGNRTLEAITSQDAAVRQTIAELPATMRQTRTTLEHVRPFAQQLGPSLDALLPALRGLRATLPESERFADLAVPALRDQVRPFVRQSVPFFDALAPAVADLNRAAPSLTGVMQTFNYLLNELAYVPGGDNQGFLAWLAWAFHNNLSAYSTGDAHGQLQRNLLLSECSDEQAIAALRDALGLKVCNPVPP